MARGKQKKYTLTSSHVEDLASGRTIAPGENVNEDDLDLSAKDNKSRDQRLIDEGRLQLIPEPGSAEEKPDESKTTAPARSGGGNDGGDS